MQGRRLSRGGVGRQHHDGPLVPALHAEQRPLGVPLGGRHVLVRAAVPGDLGPAPVKPQHVQGDVRVGGPGRRVPDRARRPLRISGVCDPPALDGRIIDPGGQQPLAVGSPPVAAEAVHGLGRDMLREAVGNVVVLRGGQQAARPVGQLGHAQRAAGDVGHALPRRVDPRVRHRARGRHRFRDAGRLARVVADAQHPQPPVQREHDRPAVRVGRVGHDPGCALACSFPPDALGLGHIARTEVPRRRRIGDKPLTSSPAVGQVQPPEARDWVFTAPSTEKQHPLAVPRDRHRARNTEREAPRAGQLPGKVIDRHASTLPCGPTATRLVNRSQDVGCATQVAAQLPRCRQPHCVAMLRPWAPRHSARQRYKMTHAWTQKKRHASRENSQLAGRFRRWCQVLGSNLRRRETRANAACAGRCPHRHHAGRSRPVTSPSQIKPSDRHLRPCTPRHLVCAYLSMARPHRACHRQGAAVRAGPADRACRRLLSSSGWVRGGGGAAEEDGRLRLSGSRRR